MKADILLRKDQVDTKEDNKDVKMLKVLQFKDLRAGQRKEPYIKVT